MGNRFYSVEAVDIVKPAGQLVSMFPKEPRSTPHTGFEEKLQRKIDEIKGKTSLRSSPAPETSAAVQEALDKMPPLFRQVFEAISGGESVSDVMDAAQKHGDGSGQVRDRKSVV